MLLKRGQTQKSKLLEILSIKDIQTMCEKQASTLVIDMIAQYRSIRNVPGTFEDLINQFLNAIPKSYDRVDIVADCYRSVSIKSAEREKGEVQQKC
jgi:molecular chaperone DnaK (HSP70)